LYKNQIGVKIPVAYLKVFLTGDKRKTHSHFQKILGNVMYQLFFYIAFIRMFFDPCKVKNIRVFQQVIG
jgi:hypothetical protein